MSLLACILSGFAFLISLAVAEAIVEWVITFFHSKGTDEANSSNYVGSAPLANSSSMMRVLRRTSST